VQSGKDYEVESAEDKKLVVAGKVVCRARVINKLTPVSIVA
jgi:hypothetical protein